MASRPPIGSPALRRTIQLAHRARQEITFASFRSFATSSFDVGHLAAALALGRLATLSVVSRGATSTPSAAGCQRLERLLLRLHDVGQRRVARLVQAQVGGDHRRQLHLDRLEAAVDLALDRRACPPAISSFEANVACGQPSSAASIWPVWLASSSIACLPMITSCGALLRDDRLAAAWRPRAAAARRRSRRGCRGRRRCASAVRSVSWQAATPQETATISVATPASFSRTASSTAISSKGFIDILTLAVSTPAAVGLDADLDVVVDDALDRNEDFHRGHRTVREREFDYTVLRPRSRGPGRAPARVDPRYPREAAAIDVRSGFSAGGTRWVMKTIVARPASAWMVARDLVGQRRVEAGRGLVEDQDPRPLEQRAGDGDPLPLPAREPGAALADLGLVAAAAAPRSSRGCSASLQACDHRLERRRAGRRAAGCRSSVPAEQHASPAARRRSRARRSLAGRWRVSRPSTAPPPSVGETKPCSSSRQRALAAPDGPMIATQLPGASARSKSRSTGTDARGRSGSDTSRNSSRRPRRGSRVAASECGSAGTSMMSPRRLTAIVACWNCCHRPARRSIGCATRAANIWNATSMPTVKSGALHHQQRADAPGSRAVMRLLQRRGQRLVGRCRSAASRSRRRGSAPSSRRSGARADGSICSDLTVSMPATYSVTNAWLRAPQPGTARRGAPGTAARTATDTTTSSPSSASATIDSGTL